MTEEATRQREAASKNKAKIPGAELGEVVKVYFEVGKSDLTSSYHEPLDKVLSRLKSDEKLGVQISGYASAEGNEEFNRELSNKRARSVLDYINQKGIVRRRIIARGYGATKDEKSNATESRRVEIKLVDLGAYDRMPR